MSRLCRFKGFLIIITISFDLCHMASGRFARPGKQLSKTGQHYQLTMFKQYSNHSILL